MYIIYRERDIERERDTPSTAKCKLDGARRAGAGQGQGGAYVDTVS